MLVDAASLAVSLHILSYIYVEVLTSGGYLMNPLSDRIWTNRRQFEDKFRIKIGQKKDENWTLQN
jgi:hypothetical protein